MSACGPNDRAWGRDRRRTSMDRAPTVDMKSNLARCQASGRGWRACRSGVAVAVERVLATVGHTNDDRVRSAKPMRTGVPGGVWRTAFSSRLVSAASRKTESARTTSWPMLVSTGQSRSRKARRSRVDSTTSSNSKASIAAFRTPASVRLRSSRFVTRRFRYSTSRSIASTLSRCAVESAFDPGRSVPAEARIVASGVRRSCENSTDLRGRRHGY